MVRRKKEITFIEDLKYKVSTVLLHLFFYSLILLIIYLFMNIYA